MADIVSALFLRKITGAMAGGSIVTVMSEVAFGGGGHNVATGEPKTPSDESTGLYQEILRKPVHQITRPDSRSILVVGRLAADELIGQTISEFCMFDQAGTLVFFRTFAPRVKLSAQQIDIKVLFRF